MQLYYVVSYPKSGATWFRFLMYVLFHQKMDNSLDVQNFYPELPNQAKKVDEALEAGRPVFIKTHQAYNQDLPYFDKCTTIIYLSRNPLDCMLSKLDHYKYEGIKWVEEDNGPNKFYDDFIKEANQSPEETSDKLHGGWNFHVKSWFNSQHNVDLVHIKYEDLVKDTYTTMIKFVIRNGWDFTNEQINKAVEMCTFEKIRDLEEHELRNEIPGMFFSPKRKESFLKDNSNRFVKLGKKRDALISLPTEVILRSRLSFFNGMVTTKYFKKYEEEN